MLRRGKSLSRWESRNRYFCKVTSEIKKQRQRKARPRKKVQLCLLLG